MTVFRSLNSTIANIEALLYYTRSAAVQNQGYIPIARVVTSIQWWSISSTHSRLL